MLKRENYEKLINSRIEGEMKQLINNNYKGSEDKNNRSKEGEVVQRIQFVSRGDMIQRGKYRMDM